MNKNKVYLKGYNLALKDYSALSVSELIKIRSKFINKANALFIYIDSDDNPFLNNEKRIDFICGIIDSINKLISLKEF